MISISKRFIFIHIPKTAGTSIYSLLIDYESIVVGMNGHHYLSDKHLDVLKLDKFFKFAVVRNPWDRMLSWFLWLRDSENLPFDRTEFMNWLLIVSKAKHFVYRPQTEFIYPGVDYILRFENIDEDFKHVCDCVDIPYKKLPRKNKSSNMKCDYHNYYDDETKDIVSRGYASDILSFNYTY